MKKTKIISYIVVLIMIVMLPLGTKAEYSQPQEDSKQL